MITLNKKRTRRKSDGSFVIVYPKGKQWQSLVLRVPLAKIAKEVLGDAYELSVVFVSPAEIRTLNRIYRKKDASTDILAFPLSKTTGELYISMPDVKRRAPDFGLLTRGYLAYLFIHGCLHLKGYDHGRTMGRLEYKFCRVFQFQTPK